MNPTVKAAWVAALRSGKYKQGSGGLKGVGSGCFLGFCCLGVLCDLAAVEGIGRWHEGEETATADFCTPGGVSDAYLPDLVVTWAGATSMDPEVSHPSHGGPTTLSSLNDTEKFTFGQIADVIEAQL